MIPRNNTMAEHSSHRKQFWGVSRSLVSCCASWKSPGSNLFFLSLFLLFLIRLIIWHHFIMSVTREQPHKATNFPCSWCSFCIFLLKSDSKAVFTFLLTDYIYSNICWFTLYIRVEHYAGEMRRKKWSICNISKTFNTYFNICIQE